MNSSLQKAIAALENDLTIAIPTETVYGLAGNAFSEKAIHTIFKLKQRPLFNPLIVHIKSITALDTVAKETPDAAQKLAEAFWPRPLTLLLNKKSCIPDLVTAGKVTVAVRVPNHELTLALLNELSFPVAAPSANPFGSISPTSATHVSNYFKDQLPMILDGGECAKGVESTIVGFKNDQAILYRHGSISIEEIEAVVGKVILNIVSDHSPSAPGMLSRHYAPSTSLLISDNITNSINTFSDKRIGLLLFQNTISNSTVDYQEVLSKKGDLQEAAKNLYSALHRLDEQKLDIIIAESFPNFGLGKTINDRLNRATK